MQLFDTELCLKCKGRGFCKKPCRVYSKIKDFTPKLKTHFSGESPPEVFIGRYNYPDINAGILSPDNSEVFYDKISEKGLSPENLSSPEIWHSKKLPISEILSYRAKLIYSRFSAGIKRTSKNKKFKELMQETSMAYKPVSTEFFLEKPPRKSFEMNRYSAAIGNPAPLKFARFQENPKIKPKVEYLASDSDVKSVTSMKELYQSKIPVSDIIKILSTGLLGMKSQRKMVPTRWAITATDDTLSKQLLEKIRYYPEISEILLFHGYYVGNHYEIILLPEKFSFEVIEAYMPGTLWNQGGRFNISQDYEGFNKRKKYASNVTGAYYTVRLTLCEYLERIKRQAYCIVLREERPEYYAPLGVGILRQLSREAFEKEPEKFSTIKEALEKAQTRLKLPISAFTEKSVLLKDYKKQTRLSRWISISLSS